MNKLKEKFIVFFLGFFVFLLLLEILLRIVGYIHLYIARSDILDKKGKNDYVILCVGDSWTFGSGAPREKSYPRQLEELLNKEIKVINFRVINRGVGGYNTAMILNELDNNIAEIKPNLIILLAGQANSWNAWGYKHYLNRHSAAYKIRSSLYNIKLYKLVKLLINNLRSNGGRHNLDTSLTAINSKYLKEAREYEEVGELDKAIECYKKLIEIYHNPNRYTYIAYFKLGKLYLLKDNDKEAVCWLSKAVELNPDHNTYGNLLYALEHYQKEYDDYRNKSINILNKFTTEDPVASDFLEMVKDEKKYNKEQNVWISLDIEKIIRICKKNEIEIIIQNYPIGGEGYPSCEIPNLISEKISLKHSIPLVDNYNVFQKLLLEGENENEYFAVDRHCNAKGYALMARNIYNVIIKQMAFSGINSEIYLDCVEFP